MNIFKNAVTLRGFLGQNADVPTSNHIQHGSFAVLMLGIASGTWKKQTCEWIPSTEWHRIICPGPFLCGFTRGMKKGEYIEVSYPGIRGGLWLGRVVSERFAPIDNRFAARRMI